jgi:3-methyl-2-oxobutanoate hydroxymethyltransferase
MITERLHIPTIGIGAGIHCDGQVQVFHDVLGLPPSFGPRHSRKYAEVGSIIQLALTQFVEEVKQRQFPTEQNSFRMNEAVIAALRGKDGNGASD